jgi:hypothetical protein
MTKEEKENLKGILNEITWFLERHDEHQFDCGSFDDLKANIENL